MKIRNIIICLAALAACSFQEMSAAKKDIVILYENDAHGALDGYVTLAGLYDAMVKADTANVGLVCVGDFVYGGRNNGLISGENVVKIMNAMNYDAIEIGNHEFDIDGENLLALLKEFNAPVLCGNLTDMEDNHLLATYTIKKYGKKKVAFIGMLTPMGMRIQRASFYDSERNQIYDLHDGDYITAMVQKAVDDARAEGADYVILLSHIGEKQNSFVSPTIIANTTGIDAVLDGHTHSVIEQQIVNDKDGNPVPLSQTGIKFANIGKLVITKDGRISTTLLPVSELSSFKSEKVQTIVDSVRDNF